ncbi:MAG: 5-formyltetrahydrofolate cyclo-ligase [Christensenellales bacterium]|jgi:5-formyltetrahydrofolate cyclo-ligase
MQKEMLRKKMQKIRAMIDPKDKETFSAIIRDKLFKMDCIQQAGCIMAYYSYKSEPDMLTFMYSCIDMGKCIALPYVVGEGDLIAVNYNYNSVMKSNIYGIPEPVIMNESEQEEPDVVIVPGIAFDMNLNRIGFGGGYYDRYLQEIDAVKIGVCFDCQIVEHICAEPHDVTMDIVVTEKRILRAK